MIIFAVCIGDTNRHAKNISLILSDEATRLAPAYDLVSSLVHKELPGHFAFDLGGQSHPEKMTKSNWQQFAHDVGLAPAATLRRVEELSQTILHHLPDVARDLAQEYPAIKKRIAGHVCHRHRRAQRSHPCQLRQGVTGLPRRQPCFEQLMGDGQRRGQKETMLALAF